MAIELRVLTPDDWPVWRELRLAALAEAPHAFGSRLADWQGPHDRAERWRERLALAGSHNLVATLDGTLAGMATGVPANDPGVVEVMSMWVQPAARGRGVGDRLLAEIERWARTRGARTLRLAVTAGNRAATGLYLRHGYRPTGELGDLMHDGTQREEVMAKHLMPPPGAR
jgi:GNAT superfamily N-acetyltransferase